jgi:hypothetical protein
MGVILVEDRPEAVPQRGLVDKRPELVSAVCTSTTGSPEPRSETSSSAAPIGTSRIAVRTG